MVKTGIISIFESKLIYQMKGHSLKLYLFSLFLLSFSIAVGAQNFHYIYLQTENQKPFYVKIDEQTIPSSSSGYIILTRLTQASYKCYIGFPKTELPDLAVYFVINDADAGYLLKNDENQGIYMVDLLTKKFIPTERQWPVIKNTIKSKDEFARILSQVVNDSSINDIAIIKMPEGSVVKSEPNKTASRPEIAQPAAIIKNTPEVVVDNKGAITKQGQTVTDEGVLITYLDNADTVRVLMTTKQNKKLKAKKNIAVIQKKSNAANPIVLKQKDTIGILKTSTVSSNPKCKKTATQKDFLDLSKKMTAEKAETVKRTMALKQFIAVCFLTEQIKTLGTLFIKEDDRYKFYVSAYPYVADAENFATLQNQLTESYYIIRFKAMVQH